MKKVYIYIKQQNITSCYQVKIVQEVTTMDKISTIILLMSIFISCCEAYKILAVFPIPAKSHKILGDGYIRNLLTDGHEVTYITSYEYENPHPNLRTIVVSSNIGALQTDVITIDKVLKNELEVMDPVLMVNNVIQIAANTVAHENVQELLNNPSERFDLVIAEWLFSEIAMGYAALYETPLIWSIPFEISWQTLELINQPDNPAYSAGFMSENSPPFTFGQRVQELLLKTMIRYLNYMYLDVFQNQEFQRVFSPIFEKRGKELPSFYDIRHNASFVLGNSHVSLGQATTLPPNYHTIGGYHISEKIEQLPENLQKIMDNAKDGVIYFSMGSILKSSSMPKEMQRQILDVFQGLKQTVLWKVEETIPDLPNNVHLLKWAPQSSILSHPNCRLFITHGGLLSTAESIHFGVPIIGIPVYGDQSINVVRSVNKGFALKVDLSNTLAKDLKDAIIEMLNDKRYTKKVKELSMIYHDRPVKPNVELTHWVKHVVLTRGAHHLKPAEQKTSVYQQLYLDLAALVAVIVLTLKYIIRRLLKRKVNSNKKNN